MSSPASSGRSRDKLWQIPALVALAATLIVLAPMIVHRSTWGDSTLFDLAARSILRRGSCYRDVFMHGPPGMVWAQLGVRCLVGWSSVGLQIADLIIFSAAVWLLVRTTQPADSPPVGSLWLAVVLYLCYFTTTEWAHCQPDVWMLVPALGALALRQRQTVELIGIDPSDRTLALPAVGEGVLWGTALLMKPFVAVPAVTCVLVSTMLTLSPLRKQRLTRRLAVDAAGLLLGGLVVGVTSVAILWISGDWNEFLASTFGGWNNDYARFSGDWGHRTVQALTCWPWPWTALHALAVPMAVVLIGRAVRERRAGREASERGTRLALLGALYLGWFFQANYLQLQFEYHIVPALLLAWGVVFGTLWSFVPRLTVALLLPATAIGLAVGVPLLKPDRLEFWADCWREGDSDRLKEALASNNGGGHTSWPDLRGAINFLREKGAGDREVTCWHWSGIALYTELAIEPSTRFVFPGSRMGYFPTFNRIIADEVMHSPQRYVVIDLLALPGTPPNYRDNIKFPPRAFEPFQPVNICHSGRYVVLELAPPSNEPKKTD